MLRVASDVSSRSAARASSRSRLPFDFFRIAGRLDAAGAAVESPALNVAAPCAGITFYGPFLRQLGFCNPQTDALAGSTLRADERSLAILLVDAATDRPVALDYGFNTTRTLTPGGTVQAVRLATQPGQLPATMRAYLMVDAYPAARAVVTLPS